MISGILPSDIIHKNEALLLEPPFSGISFEAGKVELLKQYSFTSEEVVRTAIILAFECSRTPFEFSHQGIYSALRSLGFLTNIEYRWSQVVDTVWNKIPLDNFVGNYVDIVYKILQKYIMTIVVYANHLRNVLQSEGVTNYDIFVKNILHDSMQGTVFSGCSYIRVDFMVVVRNA